MLRLKPRMTGKVEQALADARAVAEMMGDPAPHDLHLFVTLAARHDTVPAVVFKSLGLEGWRIAYAGLQEAQRVHESQKMHRQALEGSVVQALNSAADVAVRSGSDDISLAHLTAALLASGNFTVPFTQSIGLDGKKIANAIEFTAKHRAF